MRRVVSVLFGLLLSACTSNVDRFSDVVSVDKVDASQLNTPSKFKSDLVPYAHDKANYTVEWMACFLDKAKATVAIMNRDQSGFSKENFCKGWIAQSFLGEGYNVVAVNRPGYGESTGKQDLSGPQSLVAVDAALANFKKAHNQTPIVGIWGASSGATAAAFYSKKDQDIRWIMLGNGIFDAELTHKQTLSGWLKGQLDKVKGQEPNGAYEARSIAWDFDGIPKKVFIYHGKKNDAVPVAQAAAFRDSLMAQEYKVNFVVLEEAGYEMPIGMHVGVIRKLLREQQAEEKEKTP